MSGQEGGDPAQALEDHLQDEIAPVVSRRRRDGGGYDCELVEPPPTAFQTVCPVCQLVLREPHLISCCGQKICRQCLELDVQAGGEKKSCRLCGEAQFTHMQDRGLERSMKELEVKCTYIKEGCEWVGKLGDLEQHLSRETPDSKDQEDQCQYVEVECSFGCADWFQRRHISTHESKLCPNRPYTCDHCHGFQSVFKDVVENHYQRCSKYPLPCPNKCRESPFERDSLESHLRNDCPLVLIKCPYQHAGCNSELLRKDVPDHVNSGTALHLTLLARVTESLIKSNHEVRENMGLVHELSVKQVSMMTACSTWHQQQEQSHARALEELSKHIVQLTATSNVLMKENRELKQAMEEKDRQVGELSQKLSATEEQLQSLKGAVRTVRLDTTQRSDFPKEFRIQVVNVNHFTPGFYTHPHGYRLCLRVCPKGVTGSESHVAVFVYLMQGPFDKHLHWPFMGEIAVQVVNQAGDHDHVERVICFNSTTPERHSRRVKGRDVSESGWGKRCFLAHQDLLYNSVRETQYLKNQQLVVRVARVKVM